MFGRRLDVGRPGGVPSSRVGVGVMSAAIVSPQFVRVTPVYFIDGAQFRCRIGRRGPRWEIKLAGISFYQSTELYPCTAQAELLSIMFRAFLDCWGEAGIDRLWSMLDAWRDGVHANELRGVCHD